MAEGPGVYRAYANLVRDLFENGNDVDRLTGLVRGLQLVAATVLLALGSVVALVAAIVLAVGAGVPGLARRAWRALGDLRAVMFGRRTLDP